MDKKYEIEYGITELVEDAYKFNYDVDFSKLDKKDLHFQFEHNITISSANELLIVTLRVRLFNGATELVLQSVRASFIIKPFNSFVNNIDGDDINVTSPKLIDTFISVCIGAVRGMLAKNLKGTPLNGVVLPLVPMTVIRQNSVKGKK